ncbi:MAG TPA: hypothetical protein VND20_04110 [Candidatus Binataceae bacterium]|nr:hypothetical protein [Candidatus Binataceae bacterium]
MSLLDLLRPARAPRARALDRLAACAGRYATLAANLARHAAMCELPTIAADLARLADATSAQAEVLRRLLRDRGAWPAPAAAAGPEGASNWARLNADLALQGDLARELNRTLVEVEGADPGFAAALRVLATEEDRNLRALRSLALKCDPQALD